jgi:hypothetical protein
LVAEDIEYTAVYFEERLAAERPGWAYTSNLYGESHEVRNARQNGLDILDEARTTDPDAKLVWWVVKEDEEDDYGETKEVVAWKGYACESTFLGEDIVYGVPTEYAC